MKLVQAFDATQWDPSQSVGQLPIGRHKVIIEDSEVKSTNANDGSGKLVFGLRVVEGPSAGATGEYSLNLYNKSAKACEIAHRELSAICHVVGVYNVQDSVQLHNIPFLVEVANRKPTQEQEERRARGEEVTLYTEVKKVFDVNGNAPGKKIVQSPAPSASAPATQAQPAQPDFNVAPASWATPAPEQAPAPAPAAAWAAPSQPAASASAAAAPAPAWQAGAPAGGPAPWAAR